MIILPIEPNEPYQTFSVTIEGQSYEFTLLWNARAGVWSMTIGDVDGNTIAAGMPVVSGVYIGNTRPHELFARGVFVVQCSGPLFDPKLEDLGTTAVVAYLTLGDLMAQLMVG